MPALRLSTPLTLRRPAPPTASLLSVSFYFLPPDPLVIPLVPRLGDARGEKEREEKRDTNGRARARAGAHTAAHRERAYTRKRRRARSRSVPRVCACMCISPTGGSPFERTSGGGANPYAVRTSLVYLSRVSCLPSSLPPPSPPRYLRRKILTVVIGACRHRRCGATYDDTKARFGARCHT